MGAVTGKGLSDLIREEFGLRITFFMMALLVLVNLTNMMAEFRRHRRVARAVSYQPLYFRAARRGRRLAAGRQGQLRERGEDLSVRLRGVRRLHHFRRSGEAGLERGGDLQRQAGADAGGGYIYMLIGMVGTSIAPWMQFYLQAAVVEKGVTAKEYAESRIEVIVGCIVTSVIAFFIIVACAGAIWKFGPRDINDADRSRARA